MDRSVRPSRYPRACELLGLNPIGDQYRVMNGAPDINRYNKKEYHRTQIGESFKFIDPKLKL